jgi:hypothetical protein
MTERHGQTTATITARVTSVEKIQDICIYKHILITAQVKIVEPMLKRSRATMQR